MFLLLYVKCSCIFHAYVPFFFSLIDINLCWYFSVYPPLSLSLSVNCSMAPKRKSAPSRDLFHFGASTSDSTPSHVRFYDEKARTDFSKNLSRYDIHSER